MLENLTKDNLLLIFNKLEEKINNNIKLTYEEVNYYDSLISLLENKVINDIRLRQSRIKNLNISGHSKLAWLGKELLPGCISCLTDGFTPIRSSNKCNLKCNYCYHYGTVPQLLENEFKFSYIGPSYNENDIKVFIDKKENIKEIAWVFLEPLLFLDKILSLINYVSSKGMHQHLYTNGTLLTEDICKKLSDNGLTEIRINLASTNCSSNVISNMKKATKYFKYVAIESPMYIDFFKSFMLHKYEILDSGLTHINLAELHLGDNNIGNFPNEQFYLSKVGYVSPISSRQLTYDLIEIASQDNWPIVVHDCSNETKFYRNVVKHGPVDFMYKRSEMNKMFNKLIDALKICKLI